MVGSLWIGTIVALGIDSSSISVSDAASFLLWPIDLGKASITL